MLQNPDFSGQIVVESTELDINKLEVYRLKEKLKARDLESTLPELDDFAFLKDLGLIKNEGASIKLTIAGLLLLERKRLLVVYYLKPKLSIYILKKILMNTMLGWI